MFSLFMKNKRLVFTMIMFSLFLSVVAGFLIYNKKTSLNNKVIRFHVLANSDSNLDQQIKLKIKDKIINYVAPFLENSASLEESKSILISNEKNIINIANEILKEHGQTYTASVELGRFDFPVKSYGDIVFPSGKYDAFRVKLGKAEGKNWWCVMFPPLCFIDAKNAVSSEKMEDELEKVLTDKEVKSISQKTEDKTSVRSDKTTKNIKKESKKSNKDKSNNKKAETSNKKIIKKENSHSMKGTVKQESKKESIEKVVKESDKVDIVDTNEEKDSPKLKFKIVEIFEKIFT